MSSVAEELRLSTIRFLAVDAIEKARSGHPGAPMGAASVAYVLWDRFLRHNPANPNWCNRDRFVLSAGHASMLLYALLYLTGYDLTLEDIKNFRQWGSKTPGHPERGMTPGIEATTGPLGQGFGESVGLAYAETFLAARYNRPGFNIVDHHTYVLCSDGDLMEGVSSEAASLAGHLKLGKLICLYDDNKISIEGATNLTFTEDIAGRFRAYDWQVIDSVDGLNPEAVDAALRKARAESARPSLIICKTIIGYGSPHKEGTSSAHGEPLGPGEVAAAKKNLGWEYPEPFTVPPEVLAYFRQAQERGVQYEKEWAGLWVRYEQAFPGEASELCSLQNSRLPDNWDDDLAKLSYDTPKPLATRDASGRVLNALASTIPTLIGGSADLAPSTKTIISDSIDFSACDYIGRNLRFGVREHAMGCIINGLAMHGGIIPYGATFLVFCDYMRPALRMAALMRHRAIFIYSHDSIGLGEDGPTHQPIEHLASLRAMPGLCVIRPADATETTEAWRIAIMNLKQPTVLILSRQALPVLDRTQYAPASGLRQGGYVLWEADSNPDAILISTGSEVHIALEAGRQLKEKAINTRVVSLPSWDLFQSQPQAYRDSVLPPGIKARVSIEAAATFGWERWVGDLGLAIGLDRFGASAPSKVLYEKFGITAERAIRATEEVLEKT
ncbi:MAG: transketolase [Dehalococcoidia bacterium]|nr:transketolase [Dehalococcoidia bacterium]